MRRKKRTRKGSALTSFIFTSLFIFSVITLAAVLFAGKAFLSSSGVQEVATLPASAAPVELVDPVAPIDPVAPVQADQPALLLPPVQPATAAKPASVVQPAPAVKPATPVRTPTPVKPAQAVRLVPLSAPPPERLVPDKKKGTLYFVFDDAGHNLAQLEPYLNLPFPCTIAVLPGLQYSAEAARRIRKAGKEAILHQPMQALNLTMDPGPGAILKGMTASQIRSILEKNLEEVGPVTGLNNHEGSMITADRASMEAVFDVIVDYDIYFLDSRTNAETVAPALAKERNMIIWERAVFLDNSQDKASIIEAVNNGMKIAEKKGAAVMIGHIWSNQLASILTEMYPELVSEGFSLSTIAKLAIDGDDEE